MFAPTKTWRKWHRKINTTQKRYAVASALAASAVPALVMARGHKIDEVPEIPLVLDSSLESTKKTSSAADILAAVGAYDDVEKASNSKKIRAGKGKLRNRRYSARKGPLIIYNDSDGVKQAFRNLPGVELCCVTRLNLLQLAPGGHMGRFCIWSQSAADRIDHIYGPEGKNLPNAVMKNADLARIINSDEIQSILNPAKRAPAKRLRKKNAVKNIKALDKLDPYAVAARKAETRAMEARAVKKSCGLAVKRKERKMYSDGKKEFVSKVSKQGNICENGFLIN